MPESPVRQRAGAVLGHLLHRHVGASQVWSSGELGAEAPDDGGPVLIAPAGAPSSVVAEFIASARPTARGSRPDGVLRVRGARCDAVGGPRGPGVLRSRRGRGLLGPSDLLVGDAGRPWAPAPTRHSQRPVLVLELRQRSADNFFHWHVDALINLWLHRRSAAAAGAGGEDEPALLAPVGRNAWQLESLRLAGIDEGRLLPLATVGSLTAPEFRVPVRSFGSRGVPDWTVRALREVAGGDGSATPSMPTGVATAARFLHVRREGTGRRRVRGEEELARRLAKLGFEDLHPSTLGVAEQRRRFAAADVIVAAHGAALTNLAWARRGAAVVELLSLARPNLAFRRIASQAGVRHVGVLCLPADHGDQHADLVADPDLVLRVVEEQLA